MTRRAAVWRGSRWYVDVGTGRNYYAIAAKISPVGRVARDFDTHAEALAWALERVGLAPKAAS